MEKTENTKLDYYQETEYILELIIGWLNENNIGKNYEKREDIAWSLIKSKHKSAISNEDLKNIIFFIKNNEFTLEEGDLWKNLKKYFNNDTYVDFFKSVFSLKPNGLSTSPNAACGKGELFYRLLRPKSKQPNQGDILDNSKKIELKGCEARILSLSITGKDYKKILDDNFKGVIKGNIPKTGGLKGTECFEIEKNQYNDFYKRELDKIDIKTKTKIFETLLIKLGIKEDLKQKVNSILENGFNQKEYQLILLKHWFSEYKKKCNFDEFIILGDGNNVKILRDVDDLGKIKICKEYFRINQSFNIGWYIE